MWSAGSIRWVAFKNGFLLSSSSGLEVVKSSRYWRSFPSHFIWVTSLKQEHKGSWMTPLTSLPLFPLNLGMEEKELLNSLGRMLAPPPPKKWGRERLVPPAATLVASACAHVTRVQPGEDHCFLKATEGKAPFHSSVMQLNICLRGLS